MKMLLKIIIQNARSCKEVVHQVKTALPWWIKMSRCLSIMLKWPVHPHWWGGSNTWGAGEGTTCPRMAYAKQAGSLIFKIINWEVLTMMCLCFSDTFDIHNGYIAINSNFSNFQDLYTIKPSKLENLLDELNFRDELSRERYFAIQS